MVVWSVGRHATLVSVAASTYSESLSPSRVLVKTRRNGSKDPAALLDPTLNCNQMRVNMLCERRAHHRATLHANRADTLSNTSLMPIRALCVPPFRRSFVDAYIVEKGLRLRRRGLVGVEGHGMHKMNRIRF